MEKPVKDKKFMIILNPYRSITLRMIASQEERSMHRQILHWIDEGFQRWFTEHSHKEEE